MAYQKVYMNQIYSSSLLCQLAQMWRGDVLCDAIIRTGATVTKAHRVVLVAACPMLQTMVGAAAGTQLEVKLSPEINPASVTAFLRYLYEGFTMLTEDNVRDLEKIANMLQVDSITKCCLDFRKVLHNATGQSLGNDPHCHFHADQAEFRHVKASELLRSMNNGVDKRSGDSNSDLHRKRARANADDSSSYSHKSVSASGTRLNALRSQQIVEDSFELVQTEADSTPVSSAILCRQSASINVSSQLEPSPTVQVVSLPDSRDFDVSSPGSGSRQLGKSPLTVAGAAKTLDFAFSGHLSTPTVQRHSPHTISPLVAGMKSKSSSKSEIQSSLFSPTEKESANIKSGQTKFPLAVTESKPNGKSDQIVIEPMVTSPVPGVDGPDLVPSVGREKAGSPVHMRRSGGRHGRVVTASCVQEDSESSGASSTPDLTIVKVERAAGLLEGGVASLGIPQLGGDDYGYPDDGDDGSDMEAYGEGGKFGGPGDEGNQWYIQTLKDGAGESIAGPGGGLGGAQIPRHARTGYSEYTDYLPTLVKNWHPTRYSLQSRIVRALAYSKSPIVFLRPLQRKVCGVKVDLLREECFALMCAGFGKFELKHDSSHFHRDAFYKPSPRALSPDCPFLQEAGIAYDTYTENFSDVSRLTAAELTQLSLAHPQSEDVHQLCVRPEDELGQLLLAHPQSGDIQDQSIRPGVVTSAMYHST